MTGRLIVFDVDGTILDSFGIFERIVTEYSRAQGLPIPCFTTIRHGYGDPHNHDFRWGVSREEQVRHLFEAYKITDRLSRSGDPQHTPFLFDGVKEALVHLKDLGHTLGIVTSKPEEPLLYLLEYHGIGKYFSGVRSATDIKRRNEKEKPEPDMLQSVMRELKFAPEETVMVGDTTMDIRMGRAAGSHTIGVTWGTHPKQYLLDAGAHHIVETEFDDVVHKVKGIFG